MSEEERQRDVESEATLEEQLRRSIRKQKLLEKFAPQQTRALTDADIKVLMSQARMPVSALLGRTHFGGGFGWTSADRDVQPADPTIGGDEDIFPADAIWATDLDPGDARRRPVP